MADFSSDNSCELIELALTYGFRGMDVDMSEHPRLLIPAPLFGKAKYLRAADVKVGGFHLDIDLDGDEEGFTSQIGTLHPMAELASSLNAGCAYIRVPAATDQMPYHEFFDLQGKRLNQIAEVLGGKEIKLAIGFSAGKELEEGKQYPFLRNAEGMTALVRAVSASNAGLLLDTWD